MLNGVSAYAAGDGWHFVTYGLTELFVKESSDAETSGWGYEFTLCTLPSIEPPEWAFNLVFALARTTVEAGTVYGSGHRIDTNAPIDGADSRLTAIALTRDRRAVPAAFPFGNYEFLQLVGITADELTEMKHRSTDEVLERLAVEDTMLRIDATRTD